MKTEAFAWNNEERGAAIEQFIHETARKDPFLMREVLSIGIGDLNNWTNTGVVLNATCGCLIGTCAIAAVRLGRVDADAVPMGGIEDAAGFTHEVPLTLGEALARGNRRKSRWFDDVGLFVAEETQEYDDDYDYDRRSADREAAVRDYLEDLIATDLRLLGLSVPRRRAQQD